MLLAQLNRLSFTNSSGLMMCRQKMATEPVRITVIKNKYLTDHLAQADYGLIEEPKHAVDFTFSIRKIRYV
jgi:hypothetical protein